MEENNNKSRLEKLQEDLYKNDYKVETDQRDNLEQRDYDLKSDWQKKEEPKPVEPTFVDLSETPKRKRHLSPFGYILIFAALFFTASIGYAAYVLWGGDTEITAEDVDISIAGPVSIGAGEILSLDLILQNNNPVELEAIDLIIEYPDGTKSADDLITDLRRVRKPLEPIVPGGVSRETINAVLFGEEGDNKEITVLLEYQAVGSTAVFSKKKVFSIVLNAAPARIAVSALKEVSSGQEIEIEATITSNSNSELKNLMVVATYPFGFKFIESSIEPKFDDNVWVFDSVPPKGKEVIKIKGTITGQNAEERVFRFNTGLVKEDDEKSIGVVFSSFIHSLIIEKPFIGLNLVLNNSSEPVVVANNGSKISAVLTFSNNTNDYVRNLDVRLNINGNAFNEPSLKTTDGYYRSTDNTLIFSRDTDGNLEEIRPRESSSVDFEFLVFDSKQLRNIKNPEIKINANLNADRISINNVEEELKETFTKTIKIASDVFVGTYTLRDMGPFENTGPIPPKAEQETTYTIQWSISNSFNDLENAVISAVLPPYVSWNNKVSPSDEVYNYDEKTRRITWNIGNVRAGAGNDLDPKELYFQVTLTPSLTQVGGTPILLRDVYFNAKDTFTKKNIEIVGKSPDIRLNDSSAFKDHEKVVE